MLPLLAENPSTDDKRLSSTVEMLTRKYMLDWPLYDIHDEVGMFELMKLAYFRVFLPSKAPTWLRMLTV